MSRVFLVRHGPTNLKTMVGWSDVPADLSDTAALARLDRFLPHLPVVSSDLMRAVDTASAIQGTRPRLEHEEGLREINFGDWELRSGKELYEEEPEATRRFWDNPEHNRPPGGESWSELEGRVTPTVDRLLQIHPDGLIVVAHFGVVLTQLRRGLGLTIPEVLSHKIDNLSVTEIRHNGTEWEAGVINHCP